MIPVMSEEAAVRREVVPMNILIVDDEQSIRETCATVSEQCGMKAVAVATAEEALEVLEHSAVDILLTDLKLQQTNGVELLKHVHDLHPEVAVVVLTQYGTIESAVEVTRMGAVDAVATAKEEFRLADDTDAVVGNAVEEQDPRAIGLGRSDFPAAQENAVGSTNVEVLPEGMRDGEGGAGFANQVGSQLAANGMEESRGDEPAGHSREHRREEQ